MRVTIDLMKKSTQIIDLSDVINPRVGDDDLLLPLHIVYGDNQTDMRGKDVEFISEDTNKQRIYVGGTCNTNTPGDNLYMGNLTFRFPAGTFKADGTYDPDKTMFRIVDKATNKVISSVNVKITVMKNSLEFDFDPDNTSYDSRLEEMLHGFHDKGQAMLDEIKDLNDQAKSNVSGDTAATAKEAKKQADANAGDISDLKGEVAGARGRFADLPSREDAQDTAINQRETIVNANANYAAQNLRNDAQDKEIAKKANQSFITDYLSKMDLQPEGFENEAALKAKYPTGKEGIFVTVDTGHKWIYTNGEWNDCGIYQAAGIDPDLQRRITYLDTSDGIIKRTLQNMINWVVDLQWFVGSLDKNTGLAIPKDRSMNAYSSLKILGRAHAFKFEFDPAVISNVDIMEFDSNGSFITYHSVGKGGSYVSSDKVNAIRFQVYKNSGLIEQNDLRNVINNNNFRIIDYSARSVINDIDYLYHLNSLTRLTAIQGKTINANLEYGEKADTAKLNDAPLYQVVKKSCNPGDSFIISELLGGYNAVGWAFLDKDNRLLQKSPEGVNRSLVELYAPCDAATLIVNSSMPNTTVYQYAPSPIRLQEINLANEINTGYNINLKFQLGEAVPLSPEKVPGYKFEIIACHPDDVFKIYGAGGSNPRLYGFLSADNRLLSVAEPYLDASDGLDIKAPALASKLVVNFSPDNKHAELYKLSNASEIKTTNSFNQLATPPIDIKMSSYLNGIKLGKDLSTHLADFAKQGDKMVHVSTFYKVDDTLYMSYYANTRTEAEDPTKHTARLVYAPFNDLSQQTYIDVADVGQEYNGQVIDAIYDSLLLKTSDDSYMIYAFTAKLGGKFYMLYRRFDPKTKLLSDTHTMNFKAGALSGTFDTVSVHDLLAQIGIDYDYEDRDISFIQKLSPRVEDGVTQYYAGIGILHMCFVVKSSDLINWTFVSTPDFKYKPEFEPSVYVKGDNVYYFCRQRGTEANAVLAKYDINNDRWSKPILVPDTQSRYDFFEDNDQLYLVHSPLDRNHISLMQIDQNVLERSYEVATAEVQDCFYPFTQNIDDQMYMSFTQSRHHIWLTKFSPTYYSNDEVANVFSKITE